MRGGSASLGDNRQKGTVINFMFKTTSISDMWTRGHSKWNLKNAFDLSSSKVEAME
jgi:hypothetical protein